MAARTAEMIGQLVRSDGKKIGLQLALFVVVGQAIEKADKGLLDNVFAGRAIAEAALDESQETAFVACDERVPGAGIALADLPNEQSIRFRCHAKSHNALGINCSRL